MGAAPAVYLEAHRKRIEASMSDRPYTIAELAARWSCSQSAIRNMIARGDLQAFRAGGRLLRIMPAAVEEVERSGRNA